MCFELSSSEKKQAKRSLVREMLYVYACRWQTIETRVHEKASRIMIPTSDRRYGPTNAVNACVSTIHVHRYGYGRYEVRPLSPVSSMSE